MRCLAGWFIVLCGIASATAQSVPPKDPGPKRDEKSKLVAEGYKTYRIQGFTVLVHDDVLAVPAGKYEREPLEVLDRELAVVVRVVNPPAAAALRKLIVWVEWDGSDGIETGRAGSAVAVYRTGSPEALTRAGMHPLKSKTVDVVNMKSLTEEHQPKRDSGRCVLLHEFAHAVHDQILGRDEGRIKAAYAQAMERKLYDKKTQYASTSHLEFFAELSCCFLDRLDYFPNTKDDLKSHDPATHKLMEQVWGLAAKKQAPGDLVVKEPNGDAARLDGKLDEIAFNAILSGPKPSAELFAGRIVVIATWGGTAANVLDRLVAWHAELEPYGVVFIGAYPYVTPDETIRKEATDRGADFTIANGAFLPPATDGKRTALPAPQALVFDAEGACVFRGSAYEAEKAIRAAVGRRLLKQLGRDTWPEGLKPVGDAFAAGASILVVIGKLTQPSRTVEADAKADAEKLLELILAPYATKWKAAEVAAKTDPVETYLLAERYATQLKGTTLATKATAMQERLRSDPAVATELRARPLLTRIKTLHAKLSAEEGANDPTSARFRQRQAAPLAALAGGIAELEAKFPKTRAAKEAKRLGRELGLD